MKITLANLLEAGRWKKKSISRLLDSKSNYPAKINVLLTTNRVVDCFLAEARGTTI